MVIKRSWKTVQTTAIRFIRGDFARRSGVICLIAYAGLVAASTGAIRGRQMELYVSPQGKAGNPGTKNRPVRTLREAQHLVRHMNRHMTGDITVWIAAGNYRLSRPLRFTPADSGANGHTVIYRAAPGAKVIVSGAVRITGWTCINRAENLWKAPAPAALHDTRQIFVNGVRAYRTSGPLPTRLRQTAHGYRATNTVMADWKNPGHIEFVYTGGNGLWSQPSVGLGAWTEPRCPLAAIHGRDIIMAEPCWRNSTRRVKLPAHFHSGRMANLVGPGHVGKMPAYVENAYELLGTPGEWYLDTAAHSIYYVPRPTENMADADVEAPVLQRLISGYGTPAHPVTHLQFRGLRFYYATWLLPNSTEGFSEIQANYMVTGARGYARQGLCSLAPGGQCPFGDWTQEPGNVRFLYDHHIALIGDIFAHLGAAGLQLGDGSQHDRVSGCIFTDISGNGVELGGVDLPLAAKDAQTSSNRINDNHIYNVATEFHGGVGIDAGYARDTLIAHNQLNDLPYTAISIGWGGWPDKIKLPGVANYSQDNTIAYNLIFDHMLILADGGGIYTQGITGPSLAAGEKIIGNVVRDQYSSGHGIYTDNGCCNVTAAGNVIFHTNFDNWGGRHRDYYGGRNGKTFDPFLFAGNYWQEGFGNSNHLNVTLRDNHLIESLRQVPPRVINRAGIQAAFKSILNRRIGSAAAPQPPKRVAAWAGNTFAYVAWNPPVFQGTAPVVRYTIMADTGRQTSITAREFRRTGYAVIRGLQNGKAVRFRVAAVNATGESSWSIPSFAVTPSDGRIHAPGRPGMLHVHVAGSMAAVQFRGPRRNGGAPVVAYVLRILPGKKNVTITGRSVLVLAGGHTCFYVPAGLAAGRRYQVQLAAVNAAGRGPFTRTQSFQLGQ